MEQIMKQRTDGYLTKIKESEDKLAQTQKKKNDDLKARHNVDVIKRNDRIENVKRIQKMQDYQREQLLERILTDTEKAQKIK